MLKRYDTALAEFLRLKLPKVDKFGLVQEEVDVPMAFATPRRAFMFSPETVEEMAAFPPMSTPRLTEPRAILTRANMTFNYGRFVSAENVNRLGYSTDFNEILMARHPLPYDIMYQYDVTTKTFHDANLLLVQLIQKFARPVWQIDVTLPLPWGTIPVQLLFEGDQDFNVYETGEEQRILRWVGTITLEGWVPLPANWIKTVQKVSLQFINDYNGEELMAELETEYADKVNYMETGDKTPPMVWK